jgi:ubiquinone/menaquinone biosynthesis C-methylase UbiE
LGENWLAQLRAFYDKRVKELERYDDEPALNGYKAPGGSPYWTQDIQERLLDDITTKLRLAPEYYVLDVGCGTGMMLRHIAPRVAHIVGVDFSQSMIDHAKRYAPENATLLRQDAVSLSFKDQMFDRVLCYSVVMNILDDDFTRSLLTELVRVTKNGGLTLIGNVPDSEKQKEQVEVIRKLQWNQPMPHPRPLQRIIGRPRDLWRYRIRRSVAPSQGNRFSAKDFFRNFAHRVDCDINIQPVNVPGFVYAPFRFDVLLTPRSTTRKFSANYA